MTKKKLGLIVDILMYALLLTQMLYVFVGNNIHEIIGIGFFVCLIIHVVLRGWWFKTLFNKNKPASRRFFDVITCLLILTAINTVACFFIPVRFYTDTSNGLSAPLSKFSRPTQALFIMSDTVRAV